MADPCLGDSGYLEGERIRADAIITATRIRQVAAVAIAIDNALQIQDNYKAQRDIAKRGLQISQQQHGHLRDVFWPRELQMLEEFGTPEEIESIESMAWRNQGRLKSTIAGAFAKKMAETKCNAPRYCTSLNQKNLQDLHLTKSMVAANAGILGQKIAWETYQAKYDTSMQRRHQVIGLGRGLLGQAATLYGNASENIAKAGSHLGDRLNSALNSFGDAGRLSAMSGNQSELMRRAYELSESPNRVPSGLQTQGISDNGLTSIGSQGTGLNLDQAMGDFSMSASTSSFQMNNPSSQIANGTIQTPTNYPMTNRGEYQNASAEAINQGRVGNWDLARSGSKEYTFTDSNGDRGSITVNMSDFPLIFYDDQQPGSR